jgi:hypothetical protein
MSYTGACDWKFLSGVEIDQKLMDERMQWQNPDGEQADITGFQ